MKMKKRPLRAVVAVGLSAALIVGSASTSANSSLRSQMDRMLSTMSNSTAPGVFETSRRGVLSGGSFMYRNKVMDTNIVSFAPPSFNAGCGGLDLFGGSLSFINKDQMVALLRGIAANSQTFAFEIALSAMSESIRGIIKNLQKAVQAMNEFFGNSCQLAQGLVQNTTAAFSKARDNEAGLVSTLVTGVSDTFGSLTNHDGEPAADRVESTHSGTVKGNIVWGALKDKGVAGWYTGGDTALNEIIMSVSGSVIIGERQTAPDGKGKSSKMTPLPAILNVKDLTDGGNITYYNCSNTATCLNPTNTNRSEFFGFKILILEMMVGTEVPGSTKQGILSKMRNNIPLNDGEKSFIANLPGSVGSLFFTLSRVSHDVAKQFVIDASGAIGREYAMDLVDALAQSALVATRANQKLADSQKAEETILEAIDKNRDMYSQLVSKYGSVTDIVGKYNTLLQASQKHITQFSVSPVAQ